MLETKMRKNIFSGLRTCWARGRTPFQPRVSLGVMAILVVLIGLSSERAFAADSLDRQISLNIPPNTGLEDALIQWGTVAGMTVMINTATVTGVLTPGVHGNLSARDALVSILRGSGLSYSEDNGRVRVIRTEDSIRPTSWAPDAALGPNGATPLTQSDIMDSQAASQTDSDSKSNESKHNQLSTITITAEKREERLIDTPVPVTAIDAQSLTENNLVQLQDYYASMPGVTLQPSIFGGSSLTIRGLSSGGGNATVGTLIDDVPFGGSTFANATTFVPEIDPSELQRIEVLRGPQGTLYGGDSIGGLVKYVTIDPSTSAFSGRVQGTLADTHAGDGPGYHVSAAVNIPLSDTWAMRASAFTRRDAGYIDNVYTGEHGENQLEVSGGRLSALWQASDNWSLKLSALYQRTERRGGDDVDTNIPGELNQSLLPGVGALTQQAQAYSAKVTGHFGTFDFTSLTGYNVVSYSSTLDYTLYFGFLASGSFPACLTVTCATTVVSDTATHKFTQEFRLSSPIGDHLDWLGGVFYTYEHSPEVQTDQIENATTNAFIGTALAEPQPAMLSEIAAFSDLTWKITKQFDIQFGGRESHYRQYYGQSYIGPYADAFAGAPSPAYEPTIYATGNAFTYLVTPRFVIVPDVMVYARFASGYRVGGPNPNAALVNISAEFKPDTTKEYEVGLKASVLDHAVTIDTSVYYIDWKDIQLAFISNGFGYEANGSAAKSQGVEFSVETLPWTGMKISSWVAFNYAALTQALPPADVAAGATGVSGTLLPGSTRFSGNAAFTQSFPITSGVTGFVGAKVAYIGEGPPPVFSNPPMQGGRAYAKTDISSGVNWDSWTVNLFINNATDRRAIIGENGSDFNPLAVNYITPRTAGVSVARTF